MSVVEGRAVGCAVGCVTTVASFVETCVGLSDTIIVSASDSGVVAGEGAVCVSSRGLMVVCAVAAEGAVPDTIVAASDKLFAGLRLSPSWSGCSVVGL